MPRTKNPIIKPIVMDLAEGNISFTRSAMAFFNGALNKDKNIKFSDIELSKALNPFALTRAVALTTGLSIGVAVDKVGENSLPAQAIKAVLVTPFTTTAAILSPLSKIDEAVVAVVNAIDKNINTHIAIPTNTNPQASINVNANVNRTQYDNSESSSSDPFIKTVKYGDIKNEENNRKIEISEYNNVSEQNKHHVSSDLSVSFHEESNVKRTEEVKNDVTEIKRRVKR